MPFLAAQTQPYSPSVEIRRRASGNDEAVSSERFEGAMQQVLEGMYRSAYLARQALLSEAREQLSAAPALARQWDEAGTEPPNDEACGLARLVLDTLAREQLAPARVSPSVEGGIEILFMEADNNRAVIEVDNSAEVFVAATYSDHGPSNVWQFDSADTLALREAISRIRVHLAS